MVTSLQLIMDLLSRIMHAHRYAWDAAFCLFVERGCS